MNLIQPTPPVNEIQPEHGMVPMKDPRNLPDYESRFYPRVNGGEAPAPDAGEQNERIKVQFAAAYYALNREHARLVALRTQTDSVSRKREEKVLLQKIEALLIARDELEDFYAPFGVIAEPVVEQGFTVDLKLSFGNVDAFGRLRSDCYTITACVPIPLQGEQINFDELPITIEGPGIRPPESITRP